MAGVTVLLAATGNGKTLWYLTRGTGAVALLLLTAGVVLGVMSSVRWRSNALPRFLVSGLHRSVTLLAVVFVAVHVVTTLADAFAPIGIQDAFLPFLSPYRPVWLGLGAVAFDLLLALIVTSIVRARIGLRMWRLVHWLAYASWPVALLHTLGTGSDARAGWLQTLALLCTGAVVLAVVWRAISVRENMPLRGLAAAGALVVPIAILVWAQGGPLRRGWAARAGTPASLIRSAQAAPSTRALAAATSRPVEVSAPSLPAGVFKATLHGRITETNGGRGLIVVQIDAVARGGFDGRVHVALRGVPLEGGGVQMLDSSVGLLPAGSPAWAAGRVVGLQGQRILADVSRAGGGSVSVELALQIDPASGTVTGQLQGGVRSADLRAAG